MLSEIIRNAESELRDTLERDPELEPDQTISEIADTQVPCYTYEILELAPTLPPELTHMPLDVEKGQSLHDVVRNLLIREVEEALREEYDDWMNLYDDAMEEKWESQEGALSAAG
jgi:hypothetical protein